MTNRRRFLIMEPFYAVTSERCTKCSGKTVMDFDYKSGYTRVCINCGKIQYAAGISQKKRNQMGHYNPTSS